MTRGITARANPAHANPARTSSAREATRTVLSWVFLWPCHLAGFVAVLAWSWPAPAAGEPVTEQHRSALRYAERARGNLPESGVQWIVEASSVPRPGAKGAARKSTGKMRLRVVNQRGAVFAEILSPENSAGSKYIVEHGRMWFYRPALSRPISVSRRQRVSGSAAVGDISSSSFLDGYEAASVVEEGLEGIACWVIELKATGYPASYDRIRYWISKSQSLGLKAEFFALSGTRLRTARWDYGNRMSFEGEEHPFISRMVVEEVKGRNQSTTLEYSDPEQGEFPAALFDPAVLEPEPGINRFDRS